MAISRSCSQRKRARVRRSCASRRYTVYKDHITLGDYEIHDGMGLELYYN